MNYTIAVKREEHGLLSRYLYDSFSVGDVLDIYYPRGDFTLEHAAKSTKPIVFLTAGIGIVPTMGMLEEITRNPCYARRPVYFIHCARNRSLHPFRAVLHDLHLNNNSIKYFIFYSQDVPSEVSEDVPEATDVRYRRISETDLQDWLPPDRDVEAYFVGPLSFMSYVKMTLTKVGVPPQQLHWEFFDHNVAGLDEVQVE